MMRTRTGATILVAAVVATTACDRVDRAQTPPPATSTPGATATSVVKIVADERGFTPTTVSVSKLPVTLEFVRTTDNTCATEVVFPDLNVTKPLPLNTPVQILVAAGGSKTYAFACGMGMFRGKVVVQ